ncbi:MAG: hypothetical protein WEA56_10815 [Balneolaceae bacterium]
MELEDYVNRYDEIKAYGLDQKLIKQLEWFIIFNVENNRNAFCESRFYKKFKHHEVVKQAFREYERRMEIKND